MYEQNINVRNSIAMIRKIATQAGRASVIKNKITEMLKIKIKVNTYVYTANYEYKLDYPQRLKQLQLLSHWI